MEKIEFKILKQFIPKVKLNSIYGGYWYNNDGELIPWIINEPEKNYYVDNTPKVGYIVKNINDIEGLVLNGNYKWNGNIWEEITSENFNFKLPIFLTETVNNLGIMSDFDGEIEQIEQKYNFLYTGITNSKTITVYNSVNLDKYRFLIDSEFVIDWGDGSSDILDPVSSGVTHTYTSIGDYVLTLTKTSDWDKQIVKKTIKLPYSEVTLGDLHKKSQYENYSKFTGYTDNIEITGETVSRLDELKKYGSNNNYDFLTITPEYTGYSFTYSGITGDTETIRYRDYKDGKTIVFIPEDRSIFFRDEEYNGQITRNEHFIGFVEEPTIYSDIFVERGKLGVMERNFRLSEIKSTGELEIYGNGFFDVKKQ